MKRKPELTNELRRKIKNWIEFIADEIEAHEFYDDWKDAASFHADALCFQIIKTFRKYNKGDLE